MNEKKESIKQEKERKIKRGKEKRALTRMAKHLSCDEKELSLQREVLGYSNVVFKVLHGKEKYLYKEYTHGVDGEPHKGNKNSISETERYEIMWQRYFDFPRILFVCAEYKIDEYVEHENLTRKKITKKETLKELAKRIAQLHISEPLKEITKTYTETLEENRINVCKKVRSRVFTEICKKIEKKINVCNERSPFRQKMRLCHNDLQFGNILLLPDARIELIDFEHVSINDPLIEIANLFNEICTDYKKKGAPVQQKLLSTNLMLFFLNEYLKHTKDTITPEEMLQEIESLRAIPCYYWIIWAIKGLLQEKRNSGLDHFLFITHRLELLREGGLITATNAKEIKKILRYT